MINTVCHVHPEARAVASCRSCLASLCDACCNTEGMVPYCAACVREVRRSPIARYLVVLSILGAAAGGGYWTYRTYKAPYDYGRRTNTIGKLEGQLGNEPCDHPKQIALLEQMLAAGDNRGVLDRAAAFTEKCGEEPKMCGSTYLAHRRLGETDQALADLERLIDASPRAPSPLVWRATLREERNELDRAVEDLQRAWLLYPAATDIPMSLARIYERQGKLCEASVPLQELVFRYPNERFAAGLRERLTALNEQGACRVAAGKEGERVTIRQARGGMFRTDVRIGDKANASVVIDTGASHVVLVRRLAERLGVDLGRAPKGKVATANGQREALFVFLSKVTLGGLSTEQVPAMVVDDLGAGIDGLLGQTFLSRFELKQAGAVMEIAPRAGRPSAPAPHP
jgi:clan AA aspartic protease (TIGR02281 family)